MSKKILQTVLALGAIGISQGCSLTEDVGNEVEWVLPEVATQEGLCLDAPPEMTNEELACRRVQNTQAVVFGTVQNVRQIDELLLANGEQHSGQSCTANSIYAIEVELGVEQATAESLIGERVKVVLGPNVSGKWNSKPRGVGTSELRWSVANTGIRPDQRLGFAVQEHLPTGKLTVSSNAEIFFEQDGVLSSFKERMECGQKLEPLEFSVLSACSYRDVSVDSDFLVAGICSIAEERDQSTDQERETGEPEAPPAGPN